MKFSSAILTLLISTSSFASTQKSTHPVYSESEMFACKVKCIKDPSQDFVFVGSSRMQVENYCGLEKFSFNSSDQFHCPGGDTCVDPYAYVSYFYQSVSNGGHYEVSKLYNMNFVKVASDRLAYKPMINTINQSVAFECRIQNSPMFKWDIDTILRDVGNPKVSDNRKKTEKSAIKDAEGSLKNDIQNLNGKTAK